MDLDKLKAEDSGICVMLWVKELSTCEQPQDWLVAMMDTGKSAMQPLLLPAYREMIKRELIAGHVNTSSVWLSDTKLLSLPEVSSWTGHQQLYAFTHLPSWKHGRMSERDHLAKQSADL